MRHETDQLEVHLKLSPVPVDTFEVWGTESNEGYWTPRTIESLGLIRKAVASYVLKWKDLHTINARLTEAGPMPPADGLQIYLMSHCP